MNQHKPSEQLGVMWVNEVNGIPHVFTNCECGIYGCSFSQPLTGEFTRHVPPFKPLHVAGVGKITMIKHTRHYTQLPLRDAKELIDGLCDQAAEWGIATGIFIDHYNRTITITVNYLPTWPESTTWALSINYLVV